jgi:hypothetical protein
MQNNQLYTEMQPSQKTIGHQMNQIISNMKDIINKILSFVFPFEENNTRTSVFIQESWLEKTMRPTQLKDYIWHGEVKKS